MTYGLHENEWEEVKRLFSRVPNIEQAILYGSRAKGTNKPFSDVDITFIGKELTQNDLLFLMEEFSNSLLPYVFDLSIFDRLKNASLIDHIVRRGIVVYRKS